MVDLQTEALSGIAVIGIALVSFGMYPIVKLALSRKPRRARVSATSEERDGLVNKPKEKKPKKKASKKAPTRVVESDDDDDDGEEDEREDAEAAAATAADDDEGGEVRDGVMPSTTLRIHTFASTHVHLVRPSPHSKSFSAAVSLALRVPRPRERE